MSSASLLWAALIPTLWRVSGSLPWHPSRISSPFCPSLLRSNLPTFPRPAVLTLPSLPAPRARTQPRMRMVAVSFMFSICTVSSYSRSRSGAAWAHEEHRVEVARAHVPTWLRCLGARAWSTPPAASAFLPGRRDGGQPGSDPQELTPPHPCTPLRAPPRNPQLGTWKGMTRLRCSGFADVSLAEVAGVAGF